MVINAKFASVCPCCNERIVPGTKVEWSRGSKAVHLGCVGKPAVAATRTSVGRPYNRDLAMARRNYAMTGDYYGSGLYDEES